MGDPRKRGRERGTGREQGRWEGGDAGRLRRAGTDGT
jgi:hypothetical protein